MHKSTCDTIYEEEEFLPYIFVDAWKVRSKHHKVINLHLCLIYIVIWKQLFFCCNNLEAVVDKKKM